MKVPVYKFVEESHNPAIVDIANNLNLFFVAETGFGLSSSSRDLAERVVDFLNSLPEEDKIKYRYP